MDRVMLVKALVGLVLIGWLCLAGWWAIGDAEESQDELLMWGAGEADELVEQELKEGSYAEARGWLDKPGHFLFEGDPEQVHWLIEGLYEDGAKHVWFVGIEEYEGNLITAMLAAEMPKDESERQAMLQREAEFWGLEEPGPDTGQRFIVFSFD